MRALLALVLCAACAADEIEKPDLCVGSATAAVKQADRRVIGQASEYPADPTLPADDEDFAASQSARRAMAWRVVERALAPIAVAEERLGGATVPRWQTWYAKDDFERMFARLFAGLDAAGRAARAPFSAAAI